MFKPTLQLEDPEDIRERIFQAARVIAAGDPKRSYEEALHQLVLLFHLI